MIEVETGKIVYANNISGTATTAACSDSNSPLETELELKLRAQNDAKSKLRKDVAPYYITVEMKLMDSTADIPSKATGDLVRKGLDFSKSNRLDRACELWGEARIQAPNSPTILYNLGVCAEVTGRLEEALALYKEADKKLGKPDDRITIALARVNDAIQKQKKLGDQIGR